MKRNMYQWIDEIIASPVKKAFPILSFPAVQKLVVQVDQLTRDSGLQASGMCLIADSFDTAASVSYMDLSVEAEAFGSQIRYSPQDVPTVVGSMIGSIEEAKALRVPAVGEGRTGVCLDAIKRACEKIASRPVFAGAIGPFSLAGRLLDVSEAMLYCYDEPELVHIVLGKVTDFLIAYCNAFKETGANGIVVAEPLAGLLSEELAGEFSAQYMRKIVDAVQDEHFIIIYHNCGNSALSTIQTIVANGCRVFHFGNVVDMGEIMPHIPKNCVAMGNIEPAGQFRSGTPESVYCATHALLRVCSVYPNFVISSGCDIPPMSPWENIDAFFRAVSDFYQGK